MRRTALTLLATVVLAAGCAARRGVVRAGGAPVDQRSTVIVPPSTGTAPTSGAGAAASPAPSTLTWATCGQYECATMPVPLDYAQPGGRQISLALSRRRATSQSDRIGSLLVNPGGPGASGVEALPEILGRLSDGVKARFDVVGFDPRGTGNSSPVRCLPNAELEKYFAADPVPDDPAEKTSLLATVQRFVDGCKQRSGDLLAHVGTEDAARDMDRIRGAVGDEKLTYVGFSYGTSLGATYAEQFPTRVRALVLDGAVDPALDTVGLNRVQGEGFDKAFEAFVADCVAKGAACPWKPAGGPSKQAFLALSARVDARPVAAGKRQVGQSELFLGTAAFLYSRQTWSALTRALATVEAGDGSLMLRGFDTLVGRNPDGSFSNVQEANAAINCLDNPAPRDPAAYERAAAEAARTAPAFGPAIAWSGLVCGLWPVPPSGKAERLKVAGTPPILVIGTTNDPATPFVWAESLASQLPQARLLRHQGEGHTAFGQDGCTTRIGDAYLLTLALPAGPLTC